MREEIDITPGHSEAILEITSRPKTAEQVLGDTPGEVRGCSEILVTGSQDGTLRMWDLFREQSLDKDGSAEDEKGSSLQLLYTLPGYDKWLSSVVTDGWRLLSDG